MDALIYILPPAIFAEEAGPEAGWGVGGWPFFEDEIKVSDWLFQQ